MRKVIFLSIAFIHLSSVACTANGCDRSDDDYVSCELKQLSMALTSCGTIDQYQALFHVTKEMNGRGAGSWEWFQEVNDSAFLNCPEKYLNALAGVEESVAALVSARLGSALPPWDIAKVLFKYKDVDAYKKIYSLHLNRLVEDCTDENGNAKVMCNYQKSKD